jgi:hypothetical protein
MHNSNMARFVLELPAHLNPVNGDRHDSNTDSGRLCLPQQRRHRPIV